MVRQLSQYTDEQLFDFLRYAEPQPGTSWVTVAWEAPRTYLRKPKLEGVVSRGQLSRLSSERKIRVRTLTVTYWGHEREDDDLALIIQAKLDEREQ